MIGFAFCGSFCTHKKCLAVLQQLCQDYDVQPIMSETVYATDTRFGTAQALREQVEALCGRSIIHTVPGAEPFGPVIALDLLIIAPCTGNTLAKLANGITDTAVTMAAKAQLRSDRPVLLALATNDALSANLANLAIVSNRKNITMVPLFRDDPEKKPYSLISEFARIPEFTRKILRRA